MEVICTSCRRPISRQFIENHQRGPKCAADTKARLLLADGLVPCPRGRDLPACIPTVTATTRVPCARPSLIDGGAANVVGGRDPWKQEWVPSWALAVDQAWARTGRARKSRRDRLLSTLCRAQPEELRRLTAPGLADKAIVDAAERIAAGVA